MRTRNRGRPAALRGRGTAGQAGDGKGTTRRAGIRRTEPVAAARRPATTTATVAGLVALAAVTAAASVFAVPSAVSAQQEAGGEAAAATEQRPPADPADVESIDAIVTALYDVISGAKGEARDWDRFRSLMYPGAVLLPNFPEQGQGPRPLSVEEFVQFAKEQTQKQGFYESEVARKVQRYGPVANVFSTYASRRAPDEEPFVRGINSIQLVHDGSRWWVAHIAWTDTREAGPIPERYGGGGG